GLGPLGGLALDVGELGDLLPVGIEVGTALGCAQLVGERRVGGDHTEGGAVEGVGPGGEHGNGRVAAFDREGDVSAGGPPDPVALHGQHVLGPVAALQFGHVIQQPVGVVGDAEVPLVEAAAHHGGPATLTTALHDL